LSVGVGVPIVIVGQMIAISSRRKRNATEDFAKARRSNHREGFACGKAGCS
jgi:hypothetical protein